MQPDAAGGREPAWQPSQRYPDASVQVLDQSFAKYRLNLAAVERLAHGFRWCEGPVWFGDGRYLLWSDIPNNRIMKWEEETGAVSVFRKPSNFANGNTRDRQGRLVTCEHGGRRVSRTEYDGTVSVDRGSLRRQAPELAQRRGREVGRLDLVHRSAVRPARLLRGLPRRAGAADERLPGRRHQRRADGGGERSEPAERAVLLAGRVEALPRRVGQHPAQRVRLRRGRRRQAARQPPQAHRRGARHAGRHALRRGRQSLDGLGHGHCRPGRRRDLQSRTAGSSAASTCPSAAPTFASAAPTATACSWRQARASTRCT